MKTFTKLLSALLVVAMCVSLIGSGAYAIAVDMGGDFDSPVVEQETPVSGGAINNGAPAVDDGITTVTNQTVDYSGGAVDLGGSDNQPAVDNDSVSDEENGVQLEGLAKIVSLNGALSYESLDKAIDDANMAKPIVKLGGNHKLGAVTCALDAAVTELTIDLAGKTLDMSDATGSCMTITGTEDQKVVIIDSVGGGKVIGNKTDNAMFAVTNAKLTIDGGTYSDFNEDYLGTCTLLDGSFATDPTNASVTLGTGLCLKVTNLVDNNVPYSVYDVVAAAAETGDVSYPTVTEAIAAAKAAGTVTLLSDVSGESIKVNKEITLDLNGKTLTEKDPIVLEAKLTVTDSENSGRILGASASGVLFDIKEDSKAGALAIEKGAMKTYSKLYKVETADATSTPVDLSGGLYDVKPDAIDVVSGSEVYGTAAPYSIRAVATPTITGTVSGKTQDFNSEFFLQTNGSSYVNSGAIIHYTDTNDLQYNVEYVLNVSSANLNSVSVGGNTLPASAMDLANKKVTISKDSALFTNLGAGRYDIQFAFNEGTVNVPLYIMPSITAVAQYVIPDATKAGVTYTFTNPADTFDSAPTFPIMTFGKNTSSDIALTSTDFTRNATTVKVTYDFLYNKFTVGDYNMYFWFDARMGYAVPLKLTGTSNPVVSPTVAPTNSPTASPNATTTPVTSASIKLNASNTALWYNGLSNTLKFDVTPADAIVQVGGSTLTAGTHYTLDKGILTIKQSYLSQLPYKHASCVNNTTCVNGSAYTIRVVSPTDNTYAETTFQVLPSVYAVNDITQHTYGGTKTLSFTASDPIIAVYVGKILLDPSYYTLNTNTRTVTLSAAFLNNTLGIGTFYLTVLLDDADGSDHVATCAFYVVSASSAAIAQSMGDTSNIFIWIAVLVICAIAVIALIPKKKKLPAEAAEVDTEPADKQE